MLRTRHTCHVDPDQTDQKVVRSVRSQGNLKITHMQPLVQDQMPGSHMGFSRRCWTGCTRFRSAAYRATFAAPLQRVYSDAVLTRLTCILDCCMRPAHASPGTRCTCYHRLLTRSRTRPTAAKICSGSPWMYSSLSWLSLVGMGLPAKLSLAPDWLAKNLIVDPFGPSRRPHACKGNVGLASSFRESPSDNSMAT